MSSVCKSSYSPPHWVIKLFTPFLRERLKMAGETFSESSRLEKELLDLWESIWAKIMVQEPWQGTIRFKYIAKFSAAEMEPWLASPLDFLSLVFGGGKFKINFYCSNSFAATQNFKTEGDPHWQNLPERPDEV